MSERLSPAVAKGRVVRGGQGISVTRTGLAPIVRKGVCLVAFMVFWAGCARSTSPISQPPNVQAGGGRAAATEAARAEPEEVIEPGDTLEVIVRRGAGEEKYTAAVRANGIVTVAFVDTNVLGLTETEAEKRMEVQLASVIRNPRVQVRLVQKDSLRARSFYVVGEIKAPGKYPLGRRTTLLQALGQGGGFTDVADLEKVLVISRNGETPQLQVANLQSVLVRGDVNADPMLHDNDVIFVPRNGVGDFYHYYIKVGQPILYTILGSVQAAFIGKALEVLFQTSTSTGLAVGTGGVGCWVAGVLYGQHAWQTHVLRWYIWGPLSDYPAGRVFADLYLRHGRHAARFLEDHPSVRALVRPVFDYLLRRALAALDDRRTNRAALHETPTLLGAWPSTI